MRIYEKSRRNMINRALKCSTPRIRLLSNSSLITPAKHTIFGARGGVVVKALRWRSGKGTTPQTSRSRVRFPMVSLEFFTDTIFPVALWPWGRLSLYQKWVPGLFLGGKGGRCLRLTNVPLSRAVVMKSGNLKFLEPSRPPQACNGTALPL
jgi:hypothetical protein